VGCHDEKLKLERRKDHYSHFILRLAFSSTEDLRRRFARIEGALFKLRFQTDDGREKQSFVESLDFNWEVVSPEEKLQLSQHLMNASPGLKRLEFDEGSWFKVDWESVPELVESRRVFIKKGKAYVPAREQMSMVMAEFATRLDKALEVCLTCLGWLLSPAEETGHLSSSPSPLRRRPAHPNSQPSLQELCHTRFQPLGL
jgi:DNA primase large subunit